MCGKAINLLVEVFLFNVNILELGDLLEHEMLLERHGGTLQYVLLQQAQPATNFVIAHAGILHLHDTAVQGLACLALEQLLRELPIRCARELLQHLFPR